MESLVRNRRAVASAGLFVLTLCIYAGVVQHQFISLDDTKFIVDNPNLAGGLTLRNITWAFTDAYPEFSPHWRPMVWLSHMLDVGFFGYNAAGHLFTNVLLHACTGVLLFLALYSMSGGFWESLFVAGLFCVHPLRVESVAWASERKDVLSGLFFMLTLLSYGMYVRRPRATLYLGVLALFCLGLMSKTTLVSTPLLLLCLDFWPLDRFASGARGDGLLPEAGRGATNPGSGPGKRSPGRLLLEKMPFLLLAIAFSLITLIGHDQAGALSGTEMVSVSQRLGNVLHSYMAYISKTFWPSGLAVFYPYRDIPLLTWASGARAVLFVGISGLSIALIKRHPYVLVGWLWYVISLLPVIGIIQSGRQAMADRYTYLPSIGLYIMLVWGGSELARRRKVLARMLPAVAVMVLSVLGTASWAQVRYWKDSHTLFSRALEVTENNYLAHDSFGDALFNEGRYEEAIRHYRLSLEINPNYSDRVVVNYVSANYLLGNQYMQKGNPAAAITCYEDVLAMKENHVEALNNMAIALAQLGRLGEAEENLKRVIRLRPGDADPRINLARVLAAKGDVGAAIDVLKAAVTALQPNAAVHLMLGGLYEETRESALALREYETALRLQPGSAPAAEGLSRLREEAAR